MKLWEKNTTDKQSISLWNDRELDLVLAKYDALGSIAHAKMLGNIGLLTANETDMLVAALNEIIDVAAGNFTIEDSFEDVHSKEYLLTEKLGDAEKKFIPRVLVTTKFLVDVNLYLKM
jgi:argininosuccinate lyase